MNYSRRNRHFKSKRILDLKIRQKDFLMTDFLFLLAEFVMQLPQQTNLSTPKRVETQAVCNSKNNIVANSYGANDSSVAEESIIWKIKDQQLSL